MNAYHKLFTALVMFVFLCLGVSQLSMASSIQKCPQKHCSDAWPCPTYAYGIDQCYIIDSDGNFLIYSVHKVEYCGDVKFCYMGGIPQF